MCAGPAACAAGEDTASPRPLPTHTTPGVASLRPATDHKHWRTGHAARLFRNALASPGERPEGRPRLGPANAALARRTRLRRGLDRRALHRAVGAASLARSAD